MGSSEFVSFEERLAAYFSHLYTALPILKGFLRFYFSLCFLRRVDCVNSTDFLSGLTCVSLGQVDLAVLE